jgi:hypothetical protein
MIGSTIIANPFQETRMLQVRRQPATNHGCRCGQAIQQGLQQYDLNDDLNDDLNFMHQTWLHTQHFMKSCSGLPFMRGWHSNHLAHAFQATRLTVANATPALDFM